MIKDAARYKLKPMLSRQGSNQSHEATFIAIFYRLVILINLQPQCHSFSNRKMCLKFDKFALGVIRQKNPPYMQTVLIEVDNQNGFHLLQELEKLNVLRIIKEDVLKNTTKLSDKYKNVFSKEDAQSFNDHTQSMRKEWDNT